MNFFHHIKWKTLRIKRLQHYFSKWKDCYWTLETKQGHNFNSVSDKRTNSRIVWVVFLCNFNLDAPPKFGRIYYHPRKYFLANLIDRSNGGLSFRLSVRHFFCVSVHLKIMAKRLDRLSWFIEWQFLITRPNDAIQPLSAAINNYAYIHVFHFFLNF